MSSEYKMHRGKNVTFEIVESSSRFALVLEDNSNAICVSTGCILSQEDLVKLAVKMMQLALYNVEDPKEFMDKVILEYIKKLFV